MFCSAHHRDYFAEAISARLKVQASVEAVENIVPPVLDLKPLFGADATVDEGAVLDTALVDSIDIHCAAAEEEEDNDDAAREGLVSILSDLAAELRVSTKADDKGATSSVCTTSTTSAHAVLSQMLHTCFRNDVLATTATARVWNFESVDLPMRPSIGGLVAEDLRASPGKQRRRGARGARREARRGDDSAAILRPLQTATLRLVARPRPPWERMWPSDQASSPWAAQPSTTKTMADGINCRPPSAVTARALQPVVLVFPRVAPACDDGSLTTASHHAFPQCLLADMLGGGGGDGGGGGGQGDHSSSGNNSNGSSSANGSSWGADLGCGGLSADDDDASPRRSAAPVQRLQQPAAAAVEDEDEDEDEDEEDETVHLQLPASPVAF
eukprot:g2940.t1